MVIPPCFEMIAGLVFLICSLPWQALPFFCQLRCCRYSFQSFPGGFLIFTVYPSFSYLVWNCSAAVPAQGHPHPGTGQSVGWRLSRSMCPGLPSYRPHRGDGVAGNLPVQGEVAH